MSRSWVVIGAGRQGPAVAYDLAKHGSPDRIVIADFDRNAAVAAADSVNTVLGSAVLESAVVDVTDRARLTHFLQDFSLAVAAAPYRLNPAVSHAGIDVGCSVVDMGVDTPDALEVHSRNDEAAARGVTVVTDCGVAPGMVNVMASALIAENPDTVHVKLYCGGLPESARPPYYHQVEFSVESLLGEYVDTVESLVGGQVVQGAALEGLETLEFADFGALEAVTTSGGTGTAPYAHEGRLQTYEYKTLRHPGHWPAMVWMRDAGLWDEEPVVDGVSPRQVSLKLMERAMVSPKGRDVVVARVLATGPKGTQGLDMLDRFDPQTGFTAMQRTTGFSTAIIGLAVAAGKVPPGCRGSESAGDPAEFLTECAKRGIQITSSGP